MAGPPGCLHCSSQARDEAVEPVGVVASWCLWPLAGFLLFSGGRAHSAALADLRWSSVAIHRLSSSRSALSCLSRGLLRFLSFFLYFTWLLPPRSRLSTLILPLALRGVQKYYSFHLSIALVIRTSCLGLRTISSPILSFSLASWPEPSSLNTSSDVPPPHIRLSYRTQVPSPPFSIHFVLSCAVTVYR